MTTAWFDANAVKSRLSTFFDTKRKDFSLFGSTVNQTFEAFVFAQVVSWYKGLASWKVDLVHPPRKKSGPEVLRLKFSTRGAPENYSYARCVSPDGDAFQIRHQLRCATRSHKESNIHRANVCLDVAVIREMNVRGMKTYMHVPNKSLVTFGEAKHMSAFAELVAGFVGLVHEMQPNRLRRIRNPTFSIADHPPPFLFVSGTFWATGEGLVETIRRRRYDIDFYSSSQLLKSQVPLHASGDRAAPTKTAPARKPAKGKAVDAPKRKAAAKRAGSKRNV